MRNRLRSVVKYLLLLGAVMFVFWLCVHVAAQVIEHAKWSPDRLDVVRFAAVLYLARCFSEGWSRVAVWLVAFYDAWIE